MTGGDWRRLFRSEPRTIDAGLLVLRLWFGLVMAFGHGFKKVSDLDAFTAAVAQSVPFPALLAPAAALSEFFGGLLFAIGLFTRPAALMVMVTMLVAAFHVHAADPFVKKEFALAYAFAALVGLLAGPGRFSLDARLFSRRAA